MTKLIGILVVLVGLGAAAYFFLAPADGVESRLDALEDLVSKRQGERTSAMALKMERFKGLIADPCELNTTRHQAGGAYTPDELASFVMRVRATMPQLELSFHDVNVLLETETNAEVAGTVHLITSGQDGTLYRETAEVICRLRKVDGAWRFHEFEEVQVLER